MSPHNIRRLCLLATISIVATASCSVSYESTAGTGDWAGLDRSGGRSESTGAGKVPEGAGGRIESDDIFIGGSDSAAEGARTRFAELCGTGCTPGGDPAECADKEDTAPVSTPAQPLHCQLVLESGVARPRCQPAGTFPVGGPCQTAADCAAGLGCEAVDGQGGICRQYCCSNFAPCAPGTYCESRPMADSAGTEERSPKIPVCVPATNCELLNDSTCPAGLTCTIVREDGTTSCVEPGLGRAKSPCPCAPGYVCSMLTYECKKLCRIESAEQDCGAGARCQGGSMAYPAGFGVCVGGDY